jgi:hypothetical protein
MQLSLSVAPPRLQVILAYLLLASSDTRYRSTRHDYYELGTQLDLDF